MAKKILKLDFTNEFDFLLFAIVCSYKDYRLCFELNQHLKINLKRESDAEVILDKLQNRSSFSNYSYTSPLNEQYSVINNKSAIGSFIPEKKNIDYFLQIKNIQAEITADEIIEKLKQISIISGVYELEPGEIKSVENFLVFE